MTLPPPSTPENQAMLARSVTELRRARYYIEQATDDGFRLASRALRRLTTIPEAVSAVAKLQEAPQRLGAGPADIIRFVATQQLVLRLLERGLERLGGDSSPT